MADYQQNAQQVLKDGKHFADCHSADDAAEIVAALNVPARIAAHLDVEIAKRPRARAFTQGIAYARNEILAGMWREYEVAPEGARARYGEDVGHG